MSGDDVTYVFNHLGEPVQLNMIEVINQVAGVPGCRVDEVIGYGGSWLNKYVQKEMRRAIADEDRTNQRQPTLVSLPEIKESQEALCRTAMGALILLGDEDVVQKMIETSYFTVPRESLKSWFPQFFVRKGQEITKSYKIAVGATRVLDVNDASGHGWDLVDIIYHSESIVHHSALTKASVDRLPSLPLKYRLTAEDVSMMKFTSTSEHPSKFCRIVYVIELLFQGTQAFFCVVIPRSGLLRKEVDTGDNPIRIEFAPFDFMAAFGAVGAAK